MKITLEMSAARYRWIDRIVSLPFLLVPRAVQLPYRINIFLSWEGAYRLYIGQMPFRDFGLPMGFGYWLVPTGFFHLLGPTMFSLVVAQVFLNAVSLVSIRGILYNTGLKAYQVTLLLVVFCLTYVVYNFWPWYNHSVIVYELVSLCLLTAYLSSTGRSLLWLVGSAVFAFLSFYTKQDAGAVCIVICLILLAYHSVTTRTYAALSTFSVALAAIAAVAIIPFLNYDFLYWFNLGQAPHDSRVTISKLLDIFLGDVVWEKLYLMVIFLLLIYGGKEMALRIWADKKAFTLTFISLAMLGQAIVTRATSPLPTGHMTYFHAFGIGCLLTLLSVMEFKARPRVAFAALFLVIMVFSAGYWKYVSGLLGITQVTRGSETTSLPSRWIGTSFKGFEGVLIPEETVKGVNRLLESCAAFDKPVRVLNMTELTPLALELGYTPPTDQPLWYHLNIGMFDKEVDEFCRRVKSNEYDVVLFEDIPDLTHFYPYRVRDSLRQYYTLKDSFLAPRRGENSTIEVYFRKDHSTASADQAHP